MLDADTFAPASDVTAGDDVLGRDSDTGSNPQAPTGINRFHLYQAAR
jgi:hypothetical protein